MDQSKSLSPAQVKEAEANLATSQAELARSLRTEPVSRAAVAMLEAAALIAILLALLALVLGAVAERRDEAAARASPAS